MDQVNQPQMNQPKNPLLAGIASFLIPGLGQVYNGEGMIKGLLYLFGTLIGFFVLFIPGLAIWLFGVYKAYTVASKMNAGTIPVKGTTTANLIIYVVIALIIYAVYMFVLFVFAAIIAAFIFAVTPSTSY